LLISRCIFPSINFNTAFVHSSEVSNVLPFLLIFFLSYRFHARISSCPTVFSPFLDMVITLNIILIDYTLLYRIHYYILYIIIYYTLLYIIYYILYLDIIYYILDIIYYIIIYY